MNTEELLGKLGEKLVHSPYLSVMIINKKYEVVWHNQRFADEFNGGEPVEKQFCFQAAGFGKVHEDCPLQKSIQTGKCCKGFLDFGDRNFLFLTISLDSEHAAKVHIFLPKDADNAIVESMD